MFLSYENNGENVQIGKHKPLLGFLQCSFPIENNDAPHVILCSTYALVHAFLLPKEWNAKVLGYAKFKDNDNIFPPTVSENSYLQLTINNGCPQSFQFLLTI
jgi:hypothetical protein